MDFSHKLASIRSRMDEAARRAGRDPASVHLVAVAKTRSAAEDREAIRAGVTDVGENRVQEAEEKRAALTGENVRWHLVGHLQSNKAAKAVSLFDLIHSVDSVELAARSSRVTCVPTLCAGAGSRRAPPAGGFAKRPGSRWA